MHKNYQSGRTILKVIAFIVIIALLFSLIIHICQKTGASAKAEDIAKAVAERVEIYRPEIQKQRLIQMNYPSKAYYQNGPHGTTIIIQSETSVAAEEYKAGYFSIAVNVPKSKNICEALIDTDLLQAKYITINGEEDGECPGLVRFYFPTQNQENDLIKEEEIIYPTKSFEQPVSKEKNTCPTNSPYQNKNGECVACLSASHCAIEEDCVDNKCYTCPAHSSRIVRLNQRIGTTHCYCNLGYHLNDFKNTCIADNNDWNLAQNCVGNICATCPENANKNRGYRIERTNCFCNDNFVAVQTGTNQWRCELLKEETNIVVHDGEYSVHKKPTMLPIKQATRPTKKQVQRAPKKKQYQHNLKPIPVEAFQDNFTLNLPKADMQPIFIPEEIFLPIVPEYGNGNFTYTQWEELEIRFH